MVSYRCDPKLQGHQHAYIDTIKEVRTCEYELTVSTPLLCAGHAAAVAVLKLQGIDASGSADLLGGEAGSGEGPGKAAGNRMTGLGSIGAKGTVAGNNAVVIPGTALKVGCEGWLVGWLGTVCPLSHI